jgi:hypothetical protein
MIDKDSIELTNSLYELNLPLMKYDKIYYSCKILNILTKESLLNVKELNDIII